MNQKRKQKKSGFTLIEMLVVITIIGVLASIAIPGAGAVIESAKKVEAGFVLSQFQTALSMYQNDYSTWPEFLSEKADGNGDIQIGAVNNTPEDLKDLYTVLSTNEAYVLGGVTNNRRGTSYLQLSKSAYFAKSGPNKGKYTPGGKVDDFITIIDPWQRPYSFVIDGDYDNNVRVPDTADRHSGNNFVIISASVAGWSLGKETNNAKKFITSWK